ncbi:MAG: hypothetical protein F6J93_15805 [Oscillatoria sp. SIO1A7]|nr:hypothetical protein [Oscillatoria sp. SIO1A7]
MKYPSLTKLLAGLALAIGTNFVPSNPSQARTNPSDTFFCGTTRDGVPVTMVRSLRGNVPLIRWTYSAFSGSGWTPSRRCAEVSKRFQYNFETDQLQYIAIGEINAAPVLCAAAQPGIPCTKENLLITVLPGEKPEETLKSLILARDGAAPLDQSSNVMEYDEAGNLYINIEEILYHAPVE